MPKRLLLVDDDAGSLALLESALIPLGHELIRVRDGQSAIAIVEERKVDLILLDLEMPDMDGLEVLRHLRARGEAHSVPVIVLTAHSQSDEQLQGWEAGADDFFEKPPDPILLRGRVRTLLQLVESRSALAELNAELAIRNAALERLQREQRELTSFIVHDLKNPLAAVSSNVEFVRQFEGSAALSDALDQAWDASRRLRTMIDDLLIVAQLEQSQFSIHLETIRLNDLVLEVLREYDRRAEEKRVQLLKPQTVKARIETDRALLQRVIENILDNSIRYTPEHGRVGVAMRVDRCVEIAVSNSGPPIPLAERSRIFDKFARLEGGGTFRGNSGLGLYFCKRAVESLGGQIEVTETVDWPTSFIVRLPFADRAA